eukprot:TRINITY_DN7185_c0_g1_i1.p1 TRINITY_DN7185_c0_g1~~TRINITY_DN7185_c0_g1_i1.p1  ORF type:complete len:320 (-),score=67.07 TRINITY_DN7185_c0_g1_i1:167-1072(-)
MTDGFVLITPDGGVKRKLVKAGSGEDNVPNQCDVEVHYEGRLLDGTVFDSSRQRGESFKFELGRDQVIKGWDFGLRGMRRGEISILHCRADYAYGEDGVPPDIPPNATLEFEIEMIEWTAATREDNIAQTIAEAQESKQQGTVMYKQGQFALALEKYQAAHDSIAYLYPAPEGEDLTTIAKLRLHCWLNIAACRLKLKQYPEAASAATDALKLDTGNTKALFRRGQAYIGLHQWDKANSDLVSAAKAEPSNKEIRDELEALKKARIREKEVLFLHTHNVHVIFYGFCTAGVSASDDIWKVV